MDPRVLYLLRYYPTLTETFAHREMAALRDRGWAVSVATAGRRKDGGLSVPVPGIPVLRPPFWVRDRAGWLADRVRGFPRVHVHFAGEAGEWALEGRRRHGVSYTVMVHAVDLFKPRPSLPAVLAGARAVLTISTWNQRAIRERYGIDARLVRCGVPLDPARGSPGDGPFRVLAVGRWVPKKGFEDLVRAVQTLNRDVRLLLVSDAPPTLASERVEVLGLQPPARIAELLRQASLVALPSRPAPDGDMDGIPVVLMEALAAGVPVLTTAVSGIPELVDDAVGWIVAPGVDLSEALRDAADHPDERVRRGAAGPERLRERRFTLDDQVAGVLAAWD